MARPITLKERVLIALVVHLGTLVLRLLAATWRVRYEARTYEALRRRSEPVVGTLWHNRLLMLVYGFRNRQIQVLISRHRDGEMIARIAEKFGFGTVRGSTTRGGATALRELFRAARTRDVAITPDGPRGPRYEAAPGTVDVAAATGRPVLLVSGAADRAWRLRSWDGFLIPKPFARVCLRDDLAGWLPREIDAEARERARLEVERRLRRLTAELDRDAGAALDPLLAESLEGPSGPAAESPFQTAGAEGVPSSPFPAAARELEPDDADPGPAPAGPAADAITRTPDPTSAGRALSPARTALAALATGLALHALPLLLRGGGAAANPRADLCAVLLGATALAALAGPSLAVGRLWSALVGGASGALLAALGAAVPGGFDLAKAALAGILYPLIVALFGIGLSRLGRPGPRTALLSTLPPLLLAGSIFLAGPLLTLAPNPGEALFALLHLSPVTALSGSLLDIDILRAAPLYGEVPAASESPFAYPAYARALAAPALAAALAWLLSTLRSR